MKIAVATNDGVNLSQHFGQSKGFVVVAVEDSKILAKEYRANHHTPHAQGLCNHDEGHRHHGSHSHSGILNLLGDCQVVLCGGMGAGAAQALQSKGIKPVLIQGAISVDDAVKSYRNGTATVAASGSCGCH